MAHNKINMKMKGTKNMRMRREANSDCSPLLLLMMMMNWCDWLCNSTNWYYNKINVYRNSFAQTYKMKYINHMVSLAEKQPKTKKKVLNHLRFNNGNGHTQGHCSRCQHSFKSFVHLNWTRFFFRMCWKEECYWLCAFRSKVGSDQNRILQFNGGNGKNLIEFQISSNQMNTQFPKI